MRECFTRLLLLIFGMKTFEIFLVMAIFSGRKLILGCHNLFILQIYFFWFCGLSSISRDTFLTYLWLLRFIIYFWLIFNLTYCDKCLCVIVYVRIFLYACMCVCASVKLRSSNHEFAPKLSTYYRKWICFISSLNLLLNNYLYQFKYA